MGCSTTTRERVGRPDVTGQRLRPPRRPVDFACRYLSSHQVFRLQAAMSTRAGSKAGTMKPSSSWSPLLRTLQPGHQAMLANPHLCWRARSPGLVALSLLGRTSSVSSLQSSSCMARSVRSATSRSPTCCKLLIFEARPRAAQTILATALCCVPCITWLMTEACLPLSQLELTRSGGHPR